MNELIDEIYHQVIHEACADPLYRFAELVRQDERLKCSEDYLADCAAAVEAARLEERQGCAEDYLKIMRDAVERAKLREREEIIEILEGIDKIETESDQGYWETSTGAEFGANILKAIRARGMK